MNRHDILRLAQIALHIRSSVVTIDTRLQLLGVRCRFRMWSSCVWVADRCSTVPAFPDTNNEGAEQSQLLLDMAAGTQGRLELPSPQCIGLRCHWRCRTALGACQASELRDYALVCSSLPVQQSRPGAAAAQQLLGCCRLGQGDPADGQPSSLSAGCATPLDPCGACELCRTCILHWCTLVATFFCAAAGAGLGTTLQDKLRIPMLWFSLRRR
jgi:hypothetical protein